MMILELESEMRRRGRPPAARVGVSLAVTTVVLLSMTVVERSLPVRPAPGVRVDVAPSEAVRRDDPVRAARRESSSVPVAERELLFRPAAGVRVDVEPSDAATRDDPLRTEAFDLLAAAVVEREFPDRSGAVVDVVSLSEAARRDEAVRVEAGREAVFVSTTLDAREGFASLIVDDVLGFRSMIFIRDLLRLAFAAALAELLLAVEPLSEAEILVDTVLRAPLLPPDRVLTVREFADDPMLLTMLLELLLREDALREFEFPVDRVTVDRARVEGWIWVTTLCELRAREALLLAFDRAEDDAAETPGVIVREVLDEDEATERF